MFLGNSSFIVPRKYPDIIAGSALLIQQISKGVLLEKVKPDVFKGLSDMEYKSVSLSRPERTIYGLSVSSLITFGFTVPKLIFFGFINGGKRYILENVKTDNSAESIDIDCKSLS